MLLLIVLMAGAFYWRILAGRGFLWEDFVTFAYPRQYFLTQCLRRGEVPMWNPHDFSGIPFLDDVQNGVFYPFNAVTALLSPGGRLPFRLLEGVAVFHVALGGMLMFLFLRGLRFHRAPALAGAATFMFSGFLVFHLKHYNLIQACVWTPLILHHAFRILRGGGLRNAACLAGTLGVSMLAGFPQVTFYVFLMLGIIAAGWWAAGLTRGQGLRGAARGAAWFAAAFALAFSLWAAQLLPAARMSKESVRSSWAYPETIENSVRPEYLSTFVIPNMFGYLGSGEYGRVWNQTSEENYWEVHGYAGVMALIGVAAFLGGGIRRRREGWIFLGVGAFFILLSLGEYSFLHNLIYRAVPWMFGKFSSPGRALFGATVALSVFTAVGVDCLLPQNKNAAMHNARIRRRFSLSMIYIGIILILGCAVYFVLTNPPPFVHSLLGILRVGSLAVTSLLLLAFGVFAWAADRRQLLKRFVPVLFIGLVFLDLFVSHGYMNPSQTDERNHFKLPLSILNRLVPDDGNLFRVHFDETLNKEFPAEVSNVQRTGGYNRPFRLTRYRTIFNAASRNPRMLDALNVRYSVTRTGAPQPINVLRRSRKAPLTKRDLGWVRLPLTGYWEHYGFPNHDGYALYEGLIYIPKDFAGHRVRLRADRGADDEMWVFINRHKVAHPAPFHGINTVIPPGVLDPGWLNEIFIRVLDRGGLGGLLGHFWLDAGRYGSIDLANDVNISWWFNAVEGKETTRIESRPTALPRAWITRETVCPVPPEQALRRIQEPSFDFRSTALIETCGQTSPPPCDDSRADARITSYSPNRIAAQSQSRCAATLVFSEIAYPGWTATIDGRPAPLLLADYLFRAVSVPAGKHEVVLSFVSPGLRQGMALSFVAMMFTATAACFGAGLGKSRRKS